MNGKRYYLVVSDKSLMMFGPGEARVDEGKAMSDVNLQCRLASKYLARGGDWKTVVKQLKSIDITGEQTFAKSIVGVLEEYYKGWVDNVAI